MLDSESSDMGTSAALVTDSEEMVSSDGSTSVAPATSTSVTNSESSEIAASKSVAFTLTILVSSGRSSKSRRAADDGGMIDPVYVAIIDEFIAALLGPLGIHRSDITGTSFLDTMDGAINCDIVINDRTVSTRDIRNIANGKTTIDFDFPFNIPGNSIINTRIKVGQDFSFFTLRKDLKTATSDIVYLPGDGAIYEVLPSVAIGASVFGTPSPTPSPTPAPTPAPTGGPAPAPGVVGESFEPLLLDMVGDEDGAELELEIEDLLDVPDEGLQF